MFKLRGLEFHSSRMWQWSHVERAIDFMKQTGLNALIFHQNDLTDQLVFPENYFPEDDMWKRNPVRMHSIFNNRHYIAKVIRALQKEGMQFFLEVKEIWFPGDLPWKYPELLIKDGKLCPFNPFWWEFLEDKYTELFRVLPDIAGVIVSTGTRESLVSISNNTCDCSECRGKSTVDWYEKLIGSIYGPVSSAGKVLAVRDFSYSSGNQRHMIEAADRCSKDIVISLKNTPHDYYPTFPDNPSIGMCGEHPQWIEYDVWGQFFGMGVFPCSIVEDLQKRIKYSAAHGAEGILMRTDWEVITEGSIFNSLNLVNLFGAAMLSFNPDIDPDDIYKAWSNYGLYTPMKSGSVFQKPVKPAVAGTWKLLRDFMRASWKVIEKSQYVRGHLFHEDDQYCNSVKRAFEMMVDIHGRDDWEPGASKLVEATDSNINQIIHEKQLAVEESEKLTDLLDTAMAAFPEDFSRELEELLGLYRLYTRGFLFCAQGIFHAKKYEESGDSNDLAVVSESISDLERFTVEIDKALMDSEYPHYIYWLLDSKRIRELINDLQHYTGE